MKSSDVSNKKLVELFIASELKKNNIDMKQDLTTEDKKEIKRIIKHIHNQMKSFIERKKNLTEKIEKQSRKNNNHKGVQHFTDINDINTLKIYENTLQQKY
ncbi:hypothetical protein [Alkalihalobacterium elongatum]|uniref:hypothetical protein n=1 Tax=Alkalihalobacterium elongatum TaxID=2675466 RepID=UPI001C1F66CA|nr:hypothetical protein [Alkalihalobacterium elongatum]